MIKMLEAVLLVTFLQSAISYFYAPYTVEGPGGSFDIRNSPDQIKKASTVRTIVIPGDPVLDVQANSIITNRYHCTEFSMQFRVAEPFDNPYKLTLEISLPGSVVLHDNPECTIYWADGGVEGPVKIEDLPMQINHTYSSFGVYQVSMVCSAEGSGGSMHCPRHLTSCVTTENFLDDVYKQFSTPMKFFAHERITIKSYMEISSSTCGIPAINWRITNVNYVYFTPISNFIQPQTSVLSLEEGLLEPGEYVISLEVVFVEKSSQYWSEDLIIVNVVLPELVTHILGGEILDIRRGDEIFIDASISTDPGMSLKSVASTPMYANWYFAHFSVTPSDLYPFFLDFPLSTLPAGGSYYQIRAGNDYALRVNTSSFPVYTYAVVIFTLSRGDRISSAMQAIRFMDNVVPVSIECVYNCHVGRERLFYYDKIELDLKLPQYIDTSAFSYKWYIWRYHNASYSETATEAVVETGYSTSSMSITGLLYQGYTYRITAYVYAPGYSSTQVEFIRSVNYVPYDGICTLNSFEVKSARDWLTLSCTGWKGNDDRKTLDSAADINPILTYTVRQRTLGALVEEEPLLQTRSQRAHLILKTGDANQMYTTTLFIQVTDMFKSYHEIELSVKSSPAFDVNLVTPDEAGANLVKSYTLVDYPFDENQLRKMGKSDMIISLVSAVCSNFHLLNLPTWTPPVPRVLNSGGFILDLNPDGNKDVGTLDNVLETANDDETNPATLAVQDLLLNMTKLLRDVVETDLVNGSRSGDKMFTSMITNAFTNIAAKPEFVNSEAQLNIIYLSDIVGVDALTVPNTTTGDVSAEIETSSGEVYYMFQAVAGAAVPDDLRQNRPVKDLTAGRNQIDEMLLVIGDGINVDDSKLSPVERAYLYKKMQNKLRLETNHKKNTAKEAAKMATKLAREIQEKLKLCATCSNAGSTKTKQLVRKNTAGAIRKEPMSTGTSTFKLNGLQEALGNSSSDSESVSVSAFEFSENVYMYDNEGTSSYVSSKVLRVDAKTPEKRVTPGFMTFEQNVYTPPAETITPHVDEEDASEFMYHEFLYQSATDNVCLIILPLGDLPFEEYMIYIKFSGSPSLIDYDLKFAIQRETNWQFCVLPEQMKGNIGLTYLAVSVPGSIKEYKYNLTIITVSCLTWEEKAIKWHTDKCSLEWLPQQDKIVCYCREVTDMVFANSFYVAPNSIDFASVFLKFSPLRQAAVLGTISGIAVIYVIAVLFLIRLDRNDKLKWGVTFLRDNIITDTHYYILKVSTGMRRGAGTRSRIAFILTGYNEGTGPRELFDGVRDEFSTGSIMTLFMATKEHLGELQHLYIWHDNSGEGNFSSWYLNQIVVCDIEQQTTYTFVAERWLSLDTTLDAKLTACPREFPIQFETRFFYQTRDRLSESHMWLSILYRPQFSQFTRVERASCALVYIYLTMIANAMYFNPNPDYESPPLIQVGPLRFTPKQIYISIVCALMTTPVTMILIFLFKRTKKRCTRPTKLCDSTLCKSSCFRCCRKRTYVQKQENQRSYEELLLSKLLTTGTPGSKSGFYFPSWCIIIPWLLVVAGTVAPAFFILLYSMEWGKQKSEEWLTTLFLSLFESIFCVDPIMVLSVSLLLALIIRTNKDETAYDTATIVSNYRRLMGSDDNTWSSSFKILKSIKEEYSLLEYDPIVKTPPLQGDRLARAAKKYQTHVQLLTILKDVFLNLFFACIVCSICYANRDDRSFFHYSEIANNIASPRSTKLPTFDSIKTPDDLYRWVNVSVIPHLFPEFDVNGSPLHWTVKQFTRGYTNLRLGPPRIRQLRTKNGTCELPYMGKVKCYGKYSITKEDEESYCVGWRPQPCSETETVDSESMDAWKYKSAFDIWGLPIPGYYTTYGGGGYICQLDVSRNVSIKIINELFSNLWIDRQTRAVMFEFTLYNGATNIFLYNIFLVEFPETAGAFTSFTVYPLRVFTHLGAIGTYTLLCEIIFVIYLVIFLIKICIRIYQQRSKYFKQFWQNYELVMLMLGVAAAVVFAMRFGLASLTIREFKKDKYLFVNFSHIVFWDQLLVTILAVLVFMATLRILEVFSTSKKVSAVVKVFQDCGKDLFWYGVTFLHILLGFCFLGVLLFGSQILAYMNIYQCMGTLFIAMIGKSNFVEINESDPVLAKVFFMVYIFTVVFFTLTIFLSILGTSIDRVVHSLHEDKSEDVIELIFRKFMSLFKTYK